MQLQKQKLVRFLKIKRINLFYVFYVFYVFMLINCFMCFWYYSAFRALFIFLGDFQSSNYSENFFAVMKGIFREIEKHTKEV